MWVPTGLVPAQIAWHARIQEPDSEYPVVASHMLWIREPLVSFLLTLHRIQEVGDWAYMCHISCKQCEASQQCTTPSLESCQPWQLHALLVTTHLATVSQRLQHCHRKTWKIEEMTCNDDSVLPNAVYKHCQQYRSVSNYCRINNYCFWI